MTWGLEGKPEWRALANLPPEGRAPAEAVEVEPSDPDVFLSGTFGLERSRSD